MTIKSIIQWFNIAKPEPTNQDILKQIAYHFEEVAEMCKAINCQDMETALKKLKADLLAIANIQHTADEFIQNINKVELLDALCDQQVTAIGVGDFLGFEMIGALKEVNRSNYTKFAIDKDGNYVPFIKPDGKIGANTETYQDPELEPFLNKEDLESYLARFSIIEKQAEEAGKDYSITFADMCGKDWYEKVIPMFIKTYYLQAKHSYQHIHDDWIDVNNYLPLEIGDEPSGYISEPVLVRDKYNNLFIAQLYDLDEEMRNDTGCKYEWCLDVADVTGVILENIISWKPIQILPEFYPYLTFEGEI